VKIDFGKTASDYARHRAGFPARMYDLLAEDGIGQPGQRLLDLGTGTGTVARNFALRGCEVTGADPAEAQLEAAARLDRAAGLRVRYIAARAEETGLPAHSFDVVTAGQCWHWFDRAAAAAEVRRLLVPGGRLVICHFDWIPLPGNVAFATERLIEKHNPAWKLGGGNGLHAAWFEDVIAAGFEGVETRSFDIDAPYSHEDWRGRVRASAGIAASLPPAAVASFDAEHASLLARDFPGEPLSVLHRTWWLTCIAP